MLLDTDKRVLNKRATIANVREFFEKEWPTIRAQEIINEAFLGFSEAFADTYDYREYKG